MPLPVAIVEVELHQVAGDGGEDHVAGLRSERVLELEDAVVGRTARASCTASAASRENCGDSFGDGGLLGYVQDPHVGPTRHGEVGVLGANGRGRAKEAG